VLAPAGRLNASSMLDVRLHLLSSAPRPLRTRSRVHLHLGTSDVLARVVILGQSELAPGSTQYAQLRLDSPILTMPGDHYVLRGYSPAVTVGGGTVIDALPRKHRLREGRQMAAQLERLSSAGEAERIALFIEMAGERGLGQSEIAARSGSTDEVIRRTAEALAKARRAVIITSNPLLLVARPAFEELAKRVRMLIKEFHRQSPLVSGIGREEVRERLFARLSPEIFRSVVSHLIERQEVVADRDLLSLKGHRIALSAEDQAAKEHLAGVFAQAALQPISLDEAIEQTSHRFGLEAGRLQRIAQLLIGAGELVRISDLIFHRAALDELKNVLSRFKLERGARIDVAAFKDLTGVSRKYAIPLLEYLDRQRVTRRVGDAREIL
jgi:selenocysteine-specific elongation factor